MRAYKETVGQVVGVLEGKTDKIVGELRRGMEDAAEREEFEAAALYRDQIRNLELVTQTQGAVQAGSTRDRDVVGIARPESGGAEAHGTLLKIRGGRMVAVQHYHLQNADPSFTDGELVAELVSQYYSRGAAEEGREGVPEGAAAGAGADVPREVPRARAARGHGPPDAGQEPPRELDFTARGELRHAHLERGVEMASEQVSEAALGPLKVRRTWKSPVADVEFRDNGKGQAEPATIHGVEGVVVAIESRAPEPLGVLSLRASPPMR